MIAAATTVEDWRNEQLIKLGCSFSEIKLVNESEIDWHEIARLVECGCEVKTAIAILR